MAALRVAVISESEERRNGLRFLLESNGVDVVWDTPYHECCPGELDHDFSDILLVDLDESSEQEMAFIDDVIDHAQIPILFNECMHSCQHSDWGEKLVGKLEALARNSIPATETTIEGDKPVNPEELGVDLHAPHPKRLPKVHPGPDGAETVWILGASIGGPQSLKRFLGMLPADLPVGFVLAQHIGANFVPLLAEQLNRVTELDVCVAQKDAQLNNGMVMLVPADYRTQVNSKGVIEFSELDPQWPYSPSIDAVMLDFAESYGGNCNAILFSGMGNDGLQGCARIIERGGVVWGQDSESCVISSMVDHARSAGFVTVSGTPEELARELMQTLVTT